MKRLAGLSLAILRRGLLSLGLLSLGLLSPGFLVTLANGAEAPPPSPTHAGALVFLASQVRGSFPLTIGELRADVQTRIDDALAASGKVVVPSQEIIARAGAARVRSGAALSAAFLDELRTEAGLDRLTLVDLVLATDRVILLARALDTADGCVKDVWLAEAPVRPVTAAADAGAATADVLTALDVVCRTLTASAAAPATGNPLLLLPATPVGCTPEEALLATYALLHQIRVVDGRQVIDPAVARGVLLAHGHDPERLDATGRALLLTRFVTPQIVRPSLVVADEGGTASAAQRAMNDDGPPQPLPMLRGYTFTLLAVALQDGRVVAASDHHHESPPNTGLFGRPRHGSPLVDLIASASSAWAGLQPFRGDL